MPSNPERVSVDFDAVSQALADIEVQLVEPDVESSSIFLRTRDPRGYYVASTLLAFEREIRRTSAEMTKSSVTLESALRGQWTGTPESSEIKQKRKGVYPAAPSTSSLELLNARPGSTVLELQPVGEVVDLLTSVPLTVLLNSVGLYGCAKTVQAWVRKHWDPIATGLLVEAVAAAGDLGPAGFLGEDPDVEVEIPASGGRMQLGELTVHGPAEVNQITHHNDGTLSVLTVKLHG